MIADKIRSVVERWSDAIRQHGEIPMQVYESGCAELFDAARMADTIERRRVPAQLRVVGSEDAAAGVVSLDAWRRRIPDRPGGRPAPAGGPAA